MPRFRVQGRVLKADTRDMTILKNFEGFSDMNSTQILDCVLSASGSQFDLAPSTHGITSISDLYIFSNQAVTVTVTGDSSGQFEVNDYLIMRGTDLTAVSVLNELTVAAKVKIIYGGS